MDEIIDSIDDASSEDNSDESYATDDNTEDNDDDDSSLSDEELEAINLFDATIESTDTDEKQTALGHYFIVH